MTGRSSEAKKRRAPGRSRAIASGRRVVCDECKQLHPEPVCEPGAEPVVLTVYLPRWLDVHVRNRVVAGERSAWVGRLIRRELGL